MKSRMKSLHIFIGELNGVDYVISLTREGAISSIRSHYAFGDPKESSDAISDLWADELNTIGWRIREEKVNAEYVDVEVHLGNQSDSSHVSWTCPSCGISFSEDWNDHDELPITLICDCHEIRKYYLGQSGQIF